MKLLFLLLLSSAAYAAAPQAPAVTGYAVTTGAHLNWTAVAQDTDGNPVDLGLYRIYVGDTPGNYAQTVEVGANATSWDLELPAGAHYLAVTAVASDGTESEKATLIGFDVVKREKYPACYLDGTASGTRPVYDFTFSEIDGSYGRAKKLGDIPVGPATNDWATPFDRVECSCTLTTLVGTARYSLVFWKQVDGADVIGLVAGCKHYGSH